MSTQLHPALQALYGTGIDKTASEGEESDLDLSSISAADFLEAVESGEIVYDDEAEKVAGDEEGDLDLDNISASDFLAAVESGEIVYDDPDAEKTAGEDDLDLDELSNAELAAIVDQIDAEDDAADPTLEKMAADGSLDYFDTAGRIMAHAYVDQLQKTAGAEDELPEEIEINLDEISGEQLLDLQAAGYEFVAEEEAGSEKTAGFFRSIGKTVSKFPGLKGMGKSVRSGAVSDTAAKNIRAWKKANPGAWSALTKKQKRQMAADSSLLAKAEGKLPGSGTFKAKRKATRKFQRRVGVGTALGGTALFAGGTAAAMNN